MTELPKPNMAIICMDDLQKAASQKLNPVVRAVSPPGSHTSQPDHEGNCFTFTDFYNSGSTDQVTVRENSTAYGKYRLRPRVLVNVSGVDTTTTVFGQKVDFPLCISPAGIQAMAHVDGELGTSRACARRKVHMCVSSFSNYSVEDVRSAGLEVGPIQHGMQLYTMKKRDIQKRIIQRAEAAGCTAIFLTADSPVLGFRYQEVRSDFRTPEGLEFPMIEMTTEKIRSQRHDDGFSGFNSDAHSWAEDIPWLRSLTKMQIWIKGVLTAEDVLLAREYGCDGVIVSNHGGRQLDGTPATIDALPECVAAADGKIKVHIDGGIRTGADIFKALALGADCCWVGRPALWALAVDGEAGVDMMLNMLYSEFKRCMQLTGCNSIKDIGKHSLGIVRPDGPLARL